MRASGRSQARFLASPIEAFEGLDGFDAIIGRFILVHMPDPAAVLSTLASRARAGALISFIEMDMSTATAIPPLPLLAANIGRIIELYRRVGRQMDMGSHLFAAYRAAGLAPQLAGFTRIASGRRAGRLRVRHRIGAQPVAVHGQARHRDAGGDRHRHAL